MSNEPVLAPVRVASIREHVHDQLREAIISGRLQSGRRLNERDLAAELQISTSPLKEALRQLEVEGLVRTEARRGTYVNFNVRQAEEMCLARAALESIIARQAARHGTEKHFVDLESVIDEMRVAVTDAHPDLLIDLNEKFHDAIHEASGCEYLRRLQNAQRMYDHATRVTVHSQDEVRRDSFREHEAIKIAIVARDEDLAERLMREHIISAGKTHIELVFGAVRQEK